MEDNSMHIDKKVKTEEDVELTYSSVAPPFDYSKPLAQAKLQRRILRLIKKAHSKRHVIYGVKYVNRALRKDKKGIVVIGGNISPIDYISHLPVLCENKNIPYIFVPSTEELTDCISSRQNVYVAFLVPGGAKNEPFEEYKESYEKCLPKIQVLNQII